MTPKEREQKIEEFTKLVGQHDLTFAFSDDGEAQAKGHAELSELRQLAEQIDDPELTNGIWNANVDQRIVEAAREPFYW